MSSAVGLAGLTVFSSPSEAAKKPESMYPQVGDRFQITKGSLKGELLRPGLFEGRRGAGDRISLRAGRAGSQKEEIRLNRLLMVELDPADMEEETRARSAETAC